MDPFLKERKETIYHYSQIQKTLASFTSESTDEDINELFKLIPQNYLKTKDNLLMLCQIFSKLARINRVMEPIVIKLFEQILPTMKIIFQNNESLFLWKIFWGIFYFKLWMYNEGLISIETIIYHAEIDENVSQYFLPEIIEHNPDIFHNVIKLRFPCYSNPDSYSQQAIDYIKTTRKKHFDWVKNSNDFHDPLFREIETNQLRLAIKTDDLELFQSIISQNNIDINSSIGESFYDHHYESGYKDKLVGLACRCGSSNIFKFLYMNHASIAKINIVYLSVYCYNFELFHLLESVQDQLEESFQFEALESGILCWNQEIIDYALANYDFPFFSQRDFVIDKKYADIARRIMSDITYSYNFSFFDEYYFDFLCNNPHFVEANLTQFTYFGLEDQSCYFASKWMESSLVDYNADVDGQHHCLSFLALYNKNCRGLNLILEKSKVDPHFLCTRFAVTNPLAVSLQAHCNVDLVETIVKYIENTQEYKIYQFSHWPVVITMPFYNDHVEFLSPVFKHLDKYIDILNPPLNLFDYLIKNKKIGGVKFYIQEIYRRKLNHTEKFNTFINQLEKLLNPEELALFNELRNSIE